jgi:uncharacterized protein YndB with AHSA1/START domain
VKRLHFSIDINAPRDRVWAVLWDDASYREWTSVFAEGSYAITDWNEGSKVQFLDPNSGSGMVAIIEKKRPNEFMSFRHIAEIKDGVEQPPAEWSGAHENYTLTAKNGGTTVTVDLDTDEAYVAMFEEKFPQALNKVKTLAEQALGA